MLIIGIAGGTGSGKTTVVRKIQQQFPKGEVNILTHDSYYFDSSDIPLEERKKKNFDHPDSIEFDLMIEHVKSLKSGIPIMEPVYSFISCTREKETKLVEPREVLIIEGILCLFNKKLRDLMDIKVFVDCDSDVRLSRVIQRDTEERGRDVSEVLERYEKTVRPSHLQFIEPTKRYASVIFQVDTDYIMHPIHIDKRLR